MVTPFFYMLVIYALALTLLGASENHFYALAPHTKYDFLFPELTNLVFSISTITIAGLVFGFVLSSRRKRANPTTWAQWYGKSVNASQMDVMANKLYWPVTLAGVALAVVYIVYVGGVSKLPIHMMLVDAGYDEITMQRESVFKLIPAPYSYLFHFLRIAIFPILTCYGYVRLRTEPLSAKSVLPFLFVLIVGLLFNASSGQLSLPMRVLVQLAICEMYLARLKIRGMMAVVVACLVALSVIYYAMVSATDGDWGNFGEKTTKLFRERVVNIGYTLFFNAGHFTNLYNHYDNSLVGVRGIPKLALLLGKEPIAVNNELYLALEPRARIQTGTCNGPWYLYDYINFGFLGVALGSLVLGALLETMDSFLRRLGRTSIVIAICGYTTMNITALYDAPLSSWLYSQGGVIGIIMLWWLSRMSASEPLASGAPAARTLPSSI